MPFGEDNIGAKNYNLSPNDLITQVQRDQAPHTNRYVILGFFIIECF